MGVYLALVNFTRLLSEAESQPIIINDLSTDTEESKRFLDNLISVKYEKTDLFSNEPCCECGTTRGGYNLGVVCYNCNTPVRELFDQQLKPLVWMRSPKGVEPLINPIVWIMLNEKFTKSSFRIIEWLCNTDYTHNAVRPPEIDELLEMGVDRGYNNFVKNFDRYLECLFALKHFRPKKSKEDPLMTLIRENRECVFSYYLPLPNKSLMIVENTQVVTYVDPIIVGAINAIRTISSIDAPLSNLTLRQKENRTAKTMIMLSKFYYDMYHVVLASKNGIFRKHVFGTRNHFSARAVISSNTKAHQYDELHIGWGHGVTMLKMHLTNKLLKLGYSPNACTALLQEYTVKYHPLLDKLFNELIDESPEKGLVCTWNRNPSMGRGSMQRMRITKVKTDPNDPTITMSILSVRGFNADFDGSSTIAVAKLF